MKKHRFGLVGKGISYSFSKGYFTQKFTTLGLDHYSYENFDLNDIVEFPKLIADNPDIKGLNVTIPYKELVLPHLDRISKKAQKIGAVNTVRFSKKGLKGYNTDVFGFKKSIRPFLNDRHKNALILGTGGASKAVAFVFDALGIHYRFVSRNPVEDQIGYSDITEKMLKTYSILVNCSPVGTYPDISDKPTLPYARLTADHLLYDLIYNPEKTAFLQAGEKQGAAICNGRRMLELQAEKSWEIWKK